MQKIDIARKERRIETGPTQFGEDWPGLFIRGDDCIAFLGALKDREEAARFGADNTHELIELMEAVLVKKTRR